jgi:hypothetical protein
MLALKTKPKVLLKPTIGQIRDGEKAGVAMTKVYRLGIGGTSAKGTDISLDKLRVGGKVSGTQLPSSSKRTADLVATIEAL